VAREDEVKADPTRVKLTYDDFLLFPDDGKRHELIDGEHYVTPSPNMKHQAISGNLFFMIRSWLEQHSVGRIFYAPFDVVFTNFDVVEPDLLYMSHDRAAQVLTPKHVTGRRRSLSRSVHQARESGTKLIKRRLYERSAVSEYWVIDPDLELVRVYSNQDGQFGRARELSAEPGDVLTTPHLDGLELPLRRIFE
jgi:Uma2 family endonuclease